MADKTSKDPFNRITNPDGTPVRDKDNAQLVPKPSFTRRPAQNLAPGGAMGIRQRPMQSREPQLPRIEIETKMDLDDTRQLYLGRIKGEKTYSFLALVNKDEIAKGFNGSRVEELSLKEGTRQVASLTTAVPNLNFYPRTPEDLAVTNYLCETLGPMPEKTREAAEKTATETKKPPRERIQFRRSREALVPRRDGLKGRSGIAVQGDPRDLWQKGEILTMPGYSFIAKVYDEPSKFGIENGKISKLEVKKNGRTVMNYDRGWDVPPKSSEHREALQRIRNGFEDTHSKTITRPDHGKSNDKGMER